ncbi:hypothetical protein GCM10010517_40810 [Streptosporangium fragile]|uniref:Class F sortase n=1 Tax=Streptosporangium fragile TaxID=46186 RepID=A0ABN3VZC6_9ACTN
MGAARTVAALKTAGVVSTLLGAALTCWGGVVLTGRALPPPAAPVNVGAVPPAVPPAMPHTADGGVQPTGLGIPALRISARIRSVGVDARGALRVPSAPHELGWWSGGARPGSAAGRVVVAGHVDTARHGPGALFRLADALPGDEVHVRTADGGLHTYRVVARRLYPKNRLPAQVFARTGPPCLVLITCAGPFDPRTRHYRDNLVVYALPA